MSGEAAFLRGSDAEGLRLRFPAGGRVNTDALSQLTGFADLAVPSDGGYVMSGLTARPGHGPGPGIEPDG